MNGRLPLSLNSSLAGGPPLPKAATAGCVSDFAYRTSCTHLYWDEVLVRGRVPESLLGLVIGILLWTCPLPMNGPCWDPSIRMKLPICWCNWRRQKSVFWMLPMVKRLEGSEGVLVFADLCIKSLCTIVVWCLPLEPCWNEKRTLNTHKYVGCVSVCVCLPWL